MNVLVVDDVPDNLALVSSILEMDGWDVQTALSGRECLRLLQQHVPDVLVLDVHMPEISGLEVLRRLRADQELPFVPVLLLSASNLESLESNLAGQADGFLRKPISIDELLEQVHRLANLAERRPAPTAFSLLPLGLETFSYGQ